MVTFTNTIPELLETRQKEIYFKSITVGNY